MNRTRSKKYVCESHTRMTVVRIDFKTRKESRKKTCSKNKTKEKKGIQVSLLKQNAFEITSFVSIILHRYQNIISSAYFFNRVKG